MDGAAIFLEFRHFKKNSGLKVKEFQPEGGLQKLQEDLQKGGLSSLGGGSAWSTKCYSCLDVGQLVEGPVRCPVYKCEKPTDFARPRPRVPPPPSPAGWARRGQPTLLSVKELSSPHL